MRVIILKLDDIQQDKTDPLREKLISNTSHMMVLSAVSYFYDTALSNLAIIKQAGGKPEVSGIANVHIGISHSGKYIACAVGNSCVGIDVEKMRKPSERMMRKMFSESEKNSVLHLENFEKQAYAFTEIWTVKEALGKYLGTGLFGGDDLFDAESKCVQQGLYVKKFRLDDYCCTVISNEKSMEVYTAERHGDDFKFNSLEIQQGHLSNA